MKAGDVVRLKSGGPKMTIESISMPCNVAYCIWFNKNEFETYYHESNNFRCTSLEMVKDYD